MTDLAGLGRLHAPDPRDRQYALRPPRAAPTFRNWMKPGVALDQGGTSQCVAYSGVHYLTAHPVVNKPIDMQTLYDECRQVDEWPGEDYDGTSVRALFKVLTRRGYITEYRWAFDAKTVVQHILTTSPVVMGTDWTWDMMVPDKFGYIQPTGGSVGGHAYTLVGANTTRKNPDGTVGAVRVLNSWGPGWGVSGRAWLSIDHLQALIENYGEACASVEQKLVA